ncbi:MAG: response regulator [Saprospiraceae bacterium]|nr:response regulator [Saprospiraceae bacterium]
MMTLVRSLALIQIYMLACVNYSFAQYQDPGFENVQIEIEGVRLNCNIVAIKQDRNGLLWMTSNKGLISYDGYNFKLYQNALGDSTSLHDNFTHALFVDHSGGLWIGTATGLSRYNPVCDCFFNYHSSDNRIAPTGKITSIIEDYDQNLWVAAELGGLFRYESDSDSFTRFLHDSEDSITIASYIVKVLMADHQKHIWIGTGYGIWDDKGGLIRFNPATGEVKQFLHEPNNPNSLLDNRVSALLQDRENRIWVGTFQNGLHYYNPDKEEFIRMIRDPDKPDRIHASLAKRVWESPPFVQILYQDRAGGLWVGSCGGGINYFAPITNKFNYYAHDVENPNGISNDKLWSFFEDRSGQFWLGNLTQGGVHKMNPSLRKITRYSELNNLHVRKIHQSMREPGLIVLGTLHKGLQQLDLRTAKITPLHSAILRKSTSVTDHIQDVYEDSEGLLWLGFGRGDFKGSEMVEDLENGALGRLDPEMGQFSYYEIPADRFDSSHSTVYRICEDQEGYIWLGAGKNGLFGFSKDEETFDRYILSNEEGQNHDSEIYLIEKDQSGAIWVGDLAGEGALFRYDQQTNRFRSFLEGYKPLCFFEDSKRQYWIGTATGGLLHFNLDKSSFQQYTIEDGLLSNRVFDILEAPSGILWVSTDQGISKFDTESIRIMPSGIHSDEYQKTSMKAADGQLFFGGSSIVISFYPEELKGNLIPPHINLNSFSTSDETFNLIDFGSGNRDRITLSHLQNDLSFEYTGIHFSNPSKNKYKHKLEPYDHEWIRAETHRIARYTNLDPGEYKFTVIGSNDNDLWNEKGASVSFTIKSALWARWWAFFLYISLFMATIYGLYQFQLSRKLTIQDSERQTRINQVMKDFYTNITHEFRTPLTVILGMANRLMADTEYRVSNQANKSLEMIRRNGEKLVQLVNEMLDLAKLESGNLEVKAIQSDVIPYLKYLCESFHSLAQENGIKLIVYAEIDHLVMDFDSKKLETIVTNLLSNAIKFTPPGGRVIVHLSHQLVSKCPFFFIKIKDTGIGIPEDKLDKIFLRFYQDHHLSSKPRDGTGIGLALSKELVKLSGGVISVESTMGSGSEFTVQLPITKDAAKSNVQLPSLPPQEMNSSTIGITQISERGLDRHGKADEMSVFFDATENNSNKLPIALIIEDNLDVTEYLKECLKQDFYIITCTHGKEGVRTALDEVPDIIISDVMMPQMNGFEVCAILKDDERTNHIPIILLTAKATSEDKIKGLDQGADAYLIKPFEKAELMIRMTRLLEMREKLQKKYMNSLLALHGDHKEVGNNMEDFVRKVENIVLEHLSDENFSVNDLARALFLSRSQVHRKIKALTGMSTSIYVRRIRLQKAKKLLADRSLSIAEIAHHVGFKSPIYFSQAYKETFGESPSATHK